MSLPYHVTNVGQFTNPIMPNATDDAAVYGLLRQYAFGTGIKPTSKMDVRLLRNFRAAVTHRCSRLNSASRCGEFSSRIRVTQEKHPCHDPTNPIDFISLSPPRSFAVSRKKFLDTLSVNHSALLNLIFSCATNSREFISSFREFQADCSLSRI